MRPLTARSCWQQSALNRFVSLALLSGVVVGCSAGTANYDTQGAVESAAPVETSIASNESFAVDDAVPDAELVADSTAGETRSLPQLIKTAQLDLTVESVDEAIAAITDLVQQQGGDLLGLENYTPADETVRHTASMELRVPQARLENTLSKLAELGTVNRQSLTAEDVSGQLVDFESRLKNLRKAEEVVLGIMERSGEIGDVLKVGQELQNIRASIEQIDGQLNYLRNQVSYSTIQLSLDGVLPITPETSTITTQLGKSWTAATRSFGKLTLALVQLGIWFLVYTPYWLMLGAVIFLGYRLKHRPKSSSDS